jgi:flagellar biosynthesis component FlhA
VLAGHSPPSIPGDEIREPAFGLPALSVPESFGEDLKREGFQPIDNVSVVLTHLSEVIRNNLPQLLSYKDMKILIDRLDPEYRKLADEICTSHMSYSGFQAVLKLLLAERVSIRNLHLILEAVAELAPHVRKTEQIVEHVRIRMAQQLCGDIARNGQLNVLRLGNRWDLAFHQALKRDPKGEVIEFDIDPRMLEEFSEEATKVIREHMDKGVPFVLVTSPDSRPYVRMIVERILQHCLCFPTSKSRRALRSSCSARSRDRATPKAPCWRCFGVLPDWRLHHGASGVFEFSRSGPDPAFHRGGDFHGAAADPLGIPSIPTSGRARGSTFCLSAPRCSSA